MNKFYLAILLTFVATPLPVHAQQPKDFSFLTGSCAYLDRKLEDSSGIYYKGDTSIYYSMAQVPADFMLWLGDNWYLGRQDMTSAERLAYRANYTRTANVMQRLVQNPMPEYAVWDDHDYGPNNSDGHFRLKKANREVFMNTWKENPSFGENGEGTYTSFRHEDVLFVLLDCRWWRSSQRLWSYRWYSIPNKKKLMWGRQQMDWLKKQLAEDTTASYKIIVNGSQVLNPLSRNEGLVHYPVEYNELLDFVAKEVSGQVLFLTGDRHFSEIIRFQREQKLLFDITVSPLTSDSHRPRVRERNNAHRVPGTLITTQNFAHISVAGPAEQRRLEVTYYDHRGRKLVSWEIAPQIAED